MREACGDGGWDPRGGWDSRDLGLSYGLLVTLAVLLAMAALVLGTGLAQFGAGTEIGVAAAEGPAVIGPAPAVETDIGEATVQHRGPLETAPSDHLVIVRISANSCGARQSGTGVLVADGIVLTAAHVVGDAGLVRIDRDGVTVTGEVLGVSIDGRDLALVSVDAVLAQPLTLGRVDRLGEPVTIVGHPGGGPRVEVVGPRVEVEPTVDRIVHGEVMAVGADAKVGMSGGPAIDADGGLVGIIVAIETTSRTALVVTIGDVDSLTAERMIPGGCPVTA